ncbi:MAG: hypothetical protein OHK0046_46080 [Anaerolineae bacterium]
MAAEPVYSSGSYRVRRGFYPADELTAAYEIARFPKQADQGYARWFPRPTADSGLYNSYQELVRSLGGLGNGEGNAAFTWRLAGLTTGMARYITGTLFAGNQTDYFTVQTWDRSAGWWIVQCVGSLGPQGQIAQGGWRKGLVYLDIGFIVIQEAPAT